MNHRGVLKTELADVLVERKVDFLDISSGASHPEAIIKVSPTYQAPFTQAAVGDNPINVGAVGSITDGKIAHEILVKGQADIVLVGRLFQKNPVTVGDIFLAR
ncbi:hypothetical protein BDR03DRAFT_954671 [Suillus americanus]|nr:hypothetical protein BDR03DRAFT_954671 [Suillus americanus]